MGVVRTVPKTVLLDVTTRVEPKPTPSWDPTPAAGPAMVTICGEGGLESDEPGEELVWGLEGL